MGLGIPARKGHVRQGLSLPSPTNAERCLGCCDVGVVWEAVTLGHGVHNEVDAVFKTRVGIVSFGWQPGFWARASSTARALNNSCWGLFPVSRVGKLVLHTVALAMD